VIIKWDKNSYWFRQEECVR